MELACFCLAASPPGGSGAPGCQRRRVTGILMLDQQQEDEQPMTHEEKGIAMDAVLQPLFERGFDGMQEVLSTILNVAMRLEREKRRPRPRCM